ncbi:FtsX-like permease family protein [Anaerolineales bacterium HSG25]|nr:FtsX-like permease family protein [Anaerolineales bacterium HSG25]
MGRTIRVILIIAVGAFAVGTVIGAKVLMTKDLTHNWSISKPATIGLEVNPTVGDDMITTLEHLRGIETVIGWQQQPIQFRRTPDGPKEAGTLVAIDDYETQDIRKIFKDAGVWPERRMMGVQRGRGFEVGDQVYLDINDKLHPVQFNGELYNIALPPAMVIPEPMFFTTRERFEQLTGETNYSIVLATIPNFTLAQNEIAADLIQGELEKQNVEVSPANPAPGGFKVRTSEPDRFIVQDTLDGVFFILTVMAVLTLILGLFLVYNTINAIILQQVSQIGVMKAIGARFSQILGIYTVMIFVYALLGLLLAIPLGALGAHGLRVMMIVGRINMIAGPFEIAPQAIYAQAVVALLSPLLIAIVPIMSGARITVREAVSSYGLGGTSGLLDRLLVKFDALPRLLALTVGNTFRNKKRVMLTQITLVGAGTIFMMVMSVRVSLVHTFSEVIFDIFEVNVLLDLKNAQRIQEIELLTLAHPEVKAIEVWTIGQGTGRLMGQPERNDDNQLNLRGIPVPSTMYQPIMRGGRWLQPGDDQVIVLNQALAAEMGVSVGDWITIDIPTKRDANWQVIGLLFEPLDQTAAMVPQAPLQRELRQVGQGKSIKIQTWHGSAETEAAVAAELRELYEANSYNVIATASDTAHRTADQKITQMSVLLVLLTMMAVMIAIVGAIALSGTLAINVMERIREIGVMRAIGASAFVISVQFVGEGLILGWLSWLIAIPLSIPVSRIILSAISGLLNIELVYQFSPIGVFYWFAIITVLAVIASWFPAQKAAQTSVRDSLAYA